METENVNIKNWKSLIKPSKIDVKMSDDLSKATIILPMNDQQNILHY